MHSAIPIRVGVISQYSTDRPDVPNTSSAARGVRWSRFVGSPKAKTRCAPIELMPSMNGTCRREQSMSTASPGRLRGGVREPLSDDREYSGRRQPNRRSTRGVNRRAGTKRRSLSHSHRVTAWERNPRDTPTRVRVPSCGPSPKPERQRAILLLARILCHFAALQHAVAGQDGTGIRRVAPLVANEAPSRPVPQLVVVNSMQCRANSGATRRRNRRLYPPPHATSIRPATSASGSRASRRLIQPCGTSCRPFHAP